MIGIPDEKTARLLTWYFETETCPEYCKSGKLPLLTGELPLALIE